MTNLRAALEKAKPLIDLMASNCARGASEAKKAIDAALAAAPPADVRETCPLCFVDSWSDAKKDYADRAISAPSDHTPSQENDGLEDCGNWSSTDPIKRDPTPAQERREEIARIIEPESFGALDRIYLIPTDKEFSCMAAARVKADAILALPPPKGEPSQEWNAAINASNIVAGTTSDPTPPDREALLSRDWKTVEEQISSADSDRLLSLLRDYLVMNSRPGNDLAPLYIRRIDRILALRGDERGGK